MSRVTRRYSGARGYVASINRALAPLDQITGASRDFLIGQNESPLIKRKGRQIQGEAAPAAQVGLLEGKWSARPRKVFELVSAALTDGYPTWAALFNNEDSAKRYGQIIWRSTNGGGANHTFGQEFGSAGDTSTYPALGTAAAPTFKMIPLPYITEGTAGVTKATSWTRCSNKLLRRWVAPGARDVKRVGGWIYPTNFFGQPMRWNGLWGDTTTDRTQVLRAGPWGLIPPLYPPTYNTASASTGTSDQNWRDGDTFYLSVIFEFEDGSFSAPFACRAPQSGVTAAAGGLVTVGSTSATLYYRSVTYTNIAIGPPGTVARLLCVSRKVNVNTSASPPAGFNSGKVADLYPDQLFIKAKIANNIQTTYIDGNGNHDTLLPNDLVLRLDRMWALPARYAFECDQRMCLLYTRLAHPTAIIVAPTGNATSRDLNAADDSSIPYGTKQFFVRIISGTFQLCTATSAGAVTANGITVGATTTLQQLVDLINATVVGDPSNEWVAQLAPGVDGNILASNLMATSQDVASCGTTSGSASITHGSSGFADVALGMKVNGTGIPTTPLYVGSKTTNGAITLVDGNGVAANASATGTVTLTFSAESGDDDAVGGLLWGYVRAINPAMPILCPFKASFLESYARTDKQRVWYTQASPGTAAMSPNAFINNRTNFASVSAAAGIGMGGAPLTRGAVVCYSKSIYTLENRKGGSTGEDQDYRLYPLNVSRGCISPYSIASGDGWVSYLTREGLFVTDGVREVCISRDLHDAGTGAGVLSEAIAAAVQATAKDDDGAAVSFYSWVATGQLWISYVRGGVRYCQVYDYSEGLEGSGLDEVLRGGEAPYGWSAPLTIAAGPGGLVDSSTGVKHYACVNYNAGSTGDGRVDLLDAANGYDDAESVSVSGLTQNNTLVSGAAGSFSRVAVGAIVSASNSPPGSMSGKTVLAKAADDSSITLSGGSGANSGVALIFFGVEIDPIAYYATDSCEAVGKNKSAIKFTAFYTNPAGTMRLLFSRVKGSSGVYEVDLPVTGAAEYGRWTRFLPIAAQSPGETLEFGVREAGNNLATMPKVWGVDVEADVMENAI